jgi:hypothetical protein
MFCGDGERETLLTTFSPVFFLKTGPSYETVIAVLCYGLVGRCGRKINEENVEKGMIDRIF